MGPLDARTGFPSSSPLAGESVRPDRPDIGPKRLGRHRGRIQPLERLGVLPQARCLPEVLVGVLDSGGEQGNLVTPGIEHFPAQEHLVGGDPLSRRQPSGLVVPLAMGTSAESPGTARSPRRRNDLGAPWAPTQFT